MSRPMQRQSEISSDPTGRPVELELGDGSRLVLEDAASSPILCRVEGADGQPISLEDAMRLSGQPFAGYRLLRN
jgi:hypothetical protein